MKLGDRYYSYEELKEKITQYENENYVKFYLRDCRTLASTYRRMPVRISKAKPALRYYTCRYCCIQGGRKFKSRGSGQRNSRTFRQDCPAHIFFQLSRDGTALEITNLDETHNHEVSRDLFRHLPQQRRLPDEIKLKAAQMFRLNINIRQIQRELSLETGKVILLKDLHNIIKTMNTIEKDDALYNLELESEQTNSLEKSILKLQNEWNADVELLVDELNIFKGLFFQDVEMKRTFAAFPEFLCCDILHNVLNLNLECFLFHIEDSNGESEIVAACLLLDESPENFSWFLEMFKKHNPNHENIRIIIADKNIIERQILNDLFSQAKLLINMFDAMNIFQQEVTFEKYELPPNEQQKCFEIFKQMIFTKNDAHYLDIYNEFIKIASPLLVRHFNQKWHIIQHKWTVGNIFSMCNFFNSVNHRITSFKNNLKSFINAESELELFLESFFTKLYSLRKDKDHRSDNEINEYPLCKENSELAKYQSFLTPYAFKIVFEQLNILNTVENICISGSEYIVNCSEGTFNIINDECSCMVFSLLRLPCAHIFSLKMLIGDELFNESLCDQRWTADYFKTNSYACAGNDQNSFNFNSIQTTLLTKNPKEIVTSEEVTEISACDTITAQKRMETRTCEETTTSEKNNKETIYEEIQMQNKEIQTQNEEIDTQNEEIQTQNEEIQTQNEQIDNSIENIIPLNAQENVNLSFQKYKIASSLAIDLAALISATESRSEFERRINTLKQLIAKWKKGEEVSEKNLWEIYNNTLIRMKDHNYSVSLNSNISQNNSNSPETIIDYDTNYGNLIEIT